MSTRSTIAIYDEDKKEIRSIYCHWDGYIEHNGEILYNYYNTEEKVNKLISLGGLSVLDKVIGKQTNFDTPAEGQCIAYHRDRGEELVINHHNTLFGYKDYFQEYNYLFKNGKWYVEFYATEGEFEPLENYIGKEN